MLILTINIAWAKPPVLVIAESSKKAAVSPAQVPTDVGWCASSINDDEMFQNNSPGMTAFDIGIPAANVTIIARNEIGKKATKNEASLGVRSGPPGMMSFDVNEMMHNNSRVHIKRH